MHLRQRLQKICRIPARGTRWSPVEIAGSARHYSYRVEWLPEDGMWVALCVEFEFLSWLAESPAEAFTGMLRLVDDVIADMEARGVVAPQPLADQA